MVSVIIPTLNAELKLKRILPMLNRQTIPLEVVIIDSSSTDNTNAIAKNLNAKLISITRESFNHGQTRNLAVAHAIGEIVVFMTQDALLHSEFCIENLIKPLEVDSIAAVYGRQIPREECYSHRKVCETL